MSYLMGIDVGTTGAKTLLINESGEVIASAFSEYPFYTPQPQWAEQDPEDWWKATKQTIKKVLADSKVKPEEIKGLGLSGQMHGLVLLDKNYKVLRPCIMWNDQRTAEQCAWITNRIGRERLNELTCNPALTGFTAPKIIWVREKEPQIYEKTYKILLPKDYIRFRLTGEFATEVSDASGTLLLEVKKRNWSDEVLRLLGISKDLLPPVYESPEVSGTISKNTAEETGLKAGTPVVGGGGDQAAGAVGTGIVRSGLVSSTIGTSGVVFASTDEVRIDPLQRVHSFCHAVPGKWHVMGVMLSAGGSFRWFRDTLAEMESQVGRSCDLDPYELLTKEASRTEPGCEGLIFLPYLTGERTPYPDPKARGVFFGLTLRHRKADLIRAVMEGVTYGLRDSLEIIKGMGERIEQVRASGGGARSFLWCQIQADVLGTEIVTVKVTEGPAYGVALLAGVGAKIYSDVEEACDQTIRIVSVTKPIERNVRIYNEYYRVYTQLYGALKEYFSQVANIVAKFKEG